MAHTVCTGGVFLRSLLSRSMSTEVLFKESARVGLITLDRPKALNALNRPMVTDITEQLTAWRAAPHIQAVCIEGAGAKAFCAGGDVVSITKNVPASAAMDFFYHEFQMNYMIGTYPKTYVALIDGITMGGGVGLSVHGKYRVATERSLYAMPETAIGYFPDVGGSYFLSRLPQPYGMFLGLTGHRLRGADLAHMGIATHYTESDKLDALKQDILGSDSNSILATLNKHSIDLPTPFSLAPHAELIKHCFSAGSVEEILVRLGEDGSEFAEKLITTLSRMSPRSLVITHKLLSLAPGLSYEECFKMEYKAAHEIVASGEFTEGVRALLVDKDNSPQWKPPTLDQVTDAMVEKYFDNDAKEWVPLGE